MRILLTGGTGLLGAHIIKEGLTDGHTFVTISRKVSSRSFLATSPEGVEVINADLFGELPSQIFDGIDTVIHCAGLASINSADNEMMTKLNVDAGKNLFQAAKSHGIKRWIQISSVSTMCSGIERTPVNEEHIGDFRSTHYAKSKFDFDRWLLKSKEDVKVTTIHPCYMLGDWDARPSSGAILIAIRMKRVPALLDSTKNFVSPTDVAKSIFLALDKDVDGSFVVGGENILLKDFIKTVSKKLNMDPSVDFLSQEDFEDKEMKEMARAFAEEFSLTSPIDDSKAKAELGYAPSMGLEMMLDQTLNYFIEKKMIRIKRQ